MPELTINLEEHVFETLKAQCQDRGLSLLEAGRIIIGQSVMGVAASGGESLSQVSLELPPGVYEALDYSSNEMGLTLTDLATSLLAQIVYGDLIKLPKRPPTLESILGNGWMEMAAQVLSLVGVMQGSATCPHCTQRVGLESWAEGICSKCENNLHQTT